MGILAIECTLGIRTKKQHFGHFRMLVGIFCLISFYTTVCASDILAKSSLGFAFYDCIVQLYPSVLSPFVFLRFSRVPSTLSPFWEYSTKRIKTNVSFLCLDLVLVVSAVLKGLRLMSKHEFPLPRRCNRPSCRTLSARGFSFPLSHGL